MDKKKKITVLLESIIIFFLIVFLGNISGSNLFSGDINLIDEGQFGAWANHMLHGKQMFKEIYITYGPLYVYPLYLIFKILGPSMFIVRFYLLLGTALGVIAANLIMYHLDLNRNIRRIAILLLILLPGMTLRQGIGLLTIFLIMNNYNAKPLNNFFIGCLITITLLVSPEIGILIMIILFVFYFYKLLYDRNISINLMGVFSLLTGLFISILIFVYWSIKEGWFYAYLYSTIDVFKTYSGIDLPNGQNFPNPLQLIPHSLEILSWIKYLFSKELLLYWLLLFYLISIFYLFTKFILRNLSKNETKIAIIVFLGMGLYVILLGRYGIGHFFFVLQPAIIIESFFINSLFFYLKKEKKDLIGRILAIIGIFLICLFLLRLISIFRPHFSEFFNNLSYIRFTSNNNINTIGIINISSMQKKHFKIIRNFISKNTKKSDYVFFFNDEPMMYLLVDRINPTKYDLPFIANTKEKRLNLLNDLTVNNPRFIIKDKSTWDVDNVSNEKRQPEIVQFIKENYKQCKIMKSVYVYCPKSDNNAY